MRRSNTRAATLRGRVGWHGGIAAASLLVAATAAGCVVGAWLGHDMIFHQISHREGVDPVDKLAQADAWRAQQIVALVNKLKSLEEADGSSVFDNTTILWTSEIGDGSSHDYKAPAWNIIGSGQGYFKTGRYLRFAGDESSRHNLLLMHYLRYFGLDISKGFGHPDYALGSPLPGVSLA